MSLERLSREDAAILALERGVVVGHTLKLAILEPGEDGRLPTLAELRARVAARLSRAPRLRQRLAPTPLGIAPPAWVDDEAFDVARHVLASPAAEPVDERGLARLVAAAMGRRLDRAHPLWSLEAVPLTGGRMALIWKLHHCMADGQTSMRLGEEMLWGPEPAEAAPPPPGWRPTPAPAAARLAAAGLRDRVRAGRLARATGAPPPGGRSLRQLPGLLRRELRPGPEVSPFDHRLGAQRVTAFATASLAEVKRIGAQVPSHATVNDVVLAAVAGALRRWLIDHHGSPGDLRVKVPVSLHRAGAEADTEANRDSFLYASLPLGEPDARERLRRIAADTAARKREHDAEAMDRLVSDLRRASPSLERLAERLAAGARMFALSVSNVRGPAAPVYVGRARMRELHSLAEISPHHALRVSAVSYGDRLSFGLCADPGVVGDVEAVAAGITAELAALAATSS